MSNCAIAMAFIMQHPKISIIMVESSNPSNPSSPQRQTDPTKRTSEASLVSGPPPYGQMFDDCFRFRLINKSFFFSMMIALLKSAFTMISDRNFSWISKSLWKPVSYMHFFSFFRDFFCHQKGGQTFCQGRPVADLANFITLSFNEIFCFFFCREKKFWSFLH